MVGSASILTASSVELRLQRAAAWLAARARAAPVTLVGYTVGAAADLIRRASPSGAAFGWSAITLGQLAAELAVPGLALGGLAAASGLALEAVCARVVDRLDREGRLGRL